jgi:hypothetical protein
VLRPQQVVLVLQQLSLCKRQWWWWVLQSLATLTLPAQVLWQSRRGVMVRTWKLSQLY